MGGYWERLLCSIKDSVLDEEELQTALCEVQAYLNARPLVFMEDEIHERHPLFSFQLLTCCTYVGFSAVEVHDPERQPYGRGHPQWNHR
ncbi:hypothetical protein T01_3596 [Trichinella spiralis]|uniref:Uncharacterized protein n=1 Tax=Trichinella spiralis TaxID=6334 RepID=A0A0V1BT69_TRISP|nr:hypothetical protein T01_3596 [Trichinella spiralis]